MVIVLICSRRFRNNNWVGGGGYDIGSAISPTTEPSAMISASENNVVCSSRKPQTWRNDQLFNEINIISKSYYREQLQYHITTIP